MTDKIKCPVCKGKGEIEAPKNIPKDLRQEQVKVATTLREAGYSIREIMKVMNYKSPLSVQLLLKNKIIE